MTDRSVYLRHVLPQVPRLLGLLDRGPGSPTYGCFDRPYWHYAVSDFPCAECQESALTLALLYAIEAPENPYFRSPTILAWTDAAMDFWVRCQNPNGSFAEWYPHENSMSATPFSAYALSEILLRLPEAELPSRPRVLAALEKAAQWLITAKDLRVANHFAASPLALHNIFLLTGKARHAEAARRILGELAALQHEEGWFAEYGGADIGYTSVTIYYLADYVRKTDDPGALAMLERAVDFLWHFVHPDGTLGGEYGSRNTEYLIPHGFEIMARRLPKAAAVAVALRQSLEGGRHVACQSFDDRYLTYLGYSYLQAAADATDPPEAIPDLPWRAPGARTWPGAGLCAYRQPERQLIVNLKKGGVFKADFPLTGEGFTDTGVVALGRDGRTWYSAYLDPSDIGLPDGPPFRSRRRLARAKSRRLTPLSNVAQRLFMLSLGRFPRVEARIKDMLRDLLITGVTLGGLTHERTLTLPAEGLAVLDRVGPRRDVAELWLSGKASFVYGPSTRFFQPTSLEPAPIRLAAADFPAGPETGWLTVERVFDAKGRLAGTRLSAS